MNATTTENRSGTDRPRGYTQTVDRSGEKIWQHAETSLEVEFQRFILPTQMHSPESAAIDCRKYVLVVRREPYHDAAARLDGLNCLLR